MSVLVIICLIILAILAIIWLYRKISIAIRYIKTKGEIIAVKNIIPLVDKRQVGIGGNYVYTECRYQGEVYVTVRFIDRDGEEIARRYNSSAPLVLKINEHKQSAPQYTAVFPEWQIGKRVKVFYEPENTLDIFVGKAPWHRRKDTAR
jgi:hypothetical protein